MDVPTECRVNMKLKVNLLMNQTAVSANGFQNDCSFEIKKRKEIKRNHSTFIFGVFCFFFITATSAPCTERVSSLDTNDFESESKAPERKRSSVTTLTTSQINSYHALKPRQLLAPRSIFTVQLSVIFSIIR